MADTGDTETLARLLRTRRSIRDFSAAEVPTELIAAILDDARWAPSWSNTQPYKIAIAGGGLKDRLKEQLLARFDAALARAFQRLASFEVDGARMGRNAVRACFTFNLLDLQRLREDELPAYLKSVPFFDHVNQRMLGFSDTDFASWLLGELLRSRSIELRDGWILPTMAP